MSAASNARSFYCMLLATTALTPLLGASLAAAQSLPTGASVTYGSVGFQRSSGTLTINQSSQNAIVNYNAFSIGQKNTVNIDQPNSSSALLNRVTGNTPSTIAGQLNANGQVYLINPNGIAITKTGVVKVGGGFVASSLGMSDSDFLKGGKKHFRGNGASAAVSNAGTITIGRGGYAALIGGEVKNSGTIAVPLGKVGLGSGEMATLDVSGDGFLQVALPTTGGGKGALVSNSGLISAAGGTVVLDAATARAAARNAVNISGTIDAHSISGHDGSIVIGGGDGGRVAINGMLDISGGTRTAGGTVAVTGRKIKVSGTIEASGRHGGTVTLAAADGIKITGTVKAVGHKGKGGAITVTGLKIAFAGANIDASGTTGGGTVKIGGDAHGAGPLPNAGTVTIDARSVIEADSTGTGNGGSVVVWSDATTSFAGLISAKGGPRGGDGGQAEVSSHGVLDYTGTTILTAAQGSFGTLLLDPENVTISNGTDTGGFIATSDDSVINVTTLQNALATANVTVTTGSSGTQTGNITVASPFGWSSGSLLTLSAANAIAINATISITGGGQLALNTAATTLGFTTQPLLSFGTGASVSFASGQSGQALSINGTSYTLLYSMSDVANVNTMGLAGQYALAGNLDASGTTYATALIGGGSSSFSGTLEGLGHTIANLTIAAGNNINLGLIGTNAGTVRDIGLVGGTVSGANMVGGLVGMNNGGAISQVYATDAVLSPGSFAGGLVGSSVYGGAVTQAYATGAVTGSLYVGGLIGSLNTGSVTDAFATGAVKGHSYVGGLVGINNGGTISQAYATDAVLGTAYVGGLVGYIANGGSVTQAYATGVVKGTGGVGGLIGYLNGGSITNGYYDASTTGQAAGTQSNGSVGLTTAQLQTGGLAALGFDTTVWGGSAGGLYPYLNSFSPNGVQAVSGFAYQNAGVTAAASNANGAITVSLDGNGGLIGQAATGANGYYYVQLNAGSLASNAGLLVSTAANASTGATNAATLATATGSTLQTGVNLYGNATTVSTTATLLSTAPILTAAKTSATAIAGADTGAVASIAATTGRGLITTGASFTIDQAVTTGSIFYVSTKSGSPLTVSSAVTIVNGGSLGLLSGGALAVNAPVTVDGAGIVALAAAMDTTTVSGASLLELTFGNGAGLTFANADGSAASMPVSGQALSINGTRYTLEYSLGGLASAANAAPSGTYALATNVDGSNGGAGYTAAPISSFSGTFEGLGNTVNTLTIASTANNDVVGLFGMVTNGTLRDIVLAGGTVTGGNNTNNGDAGALIGLLNTSGGGTASVVNAFASTAVTGGDHVNVGGLVGKADAEYGGTTLIANSGATGAVTATGSDSNGINYGNAGGLAGFNEAGSASASATITGSYATGAVSTGPSGTAGGLTAYNYAFGAGAVATITASYATGAVTSSTNNNFGSSNAVLGGFAGQNFGGNNGTASITNAYATGSVTNTTSTGTEDGGFVAENIATTGAAVIANVFATGAVSGAYYMGGLAGQNYGGTITNVYATGALSGIISGGYNGGLIGETSGGGTLTNGYYDTQTTGMTSDSAGATGLTTRQLQGLDPVSGSTYFATLSNLGNGTVSAFAGGTGALYPYLTSFDPNGVQAISGIAYTDAGATPAASGANGAVTIGVIANRQTIGSATAGANGYYYVAVPAGTAADTLLVYSTATTAAVLTSASGTAVTGAASSTQQTVMLNGNTVVAPSQATSLSALGGVSGALTAARTAAEAADDATHDAEAAINGGTGVGILASGASFTVDQAVNTNSAFFVRTTAAGAPLTVTSPITISTGGALGLSAAGALAINAPVQVDGAAKVTLAAAMDTVTVPGASLLELTFGNGAGLTFANADGSAASSPVSGQALSINGQAYTLLYSLANTGSTGPDNGTSDIAGIDANSAAGGDNGFYALAANLTGTGTATNPQFTSALAGAYYGTPFNGTFEGLGHTITNLTIAGPSNIGLFADNAGTIRDISLAGGSIVSNDPSSIFVGSLVGWNITHGIIANAASSAAVSGSDEAIAGGLVGYSEAYYSTDVVAIVNSHATGPVSAGANNAIAGGLVGSIQIQTPGGTSAVIDSYATGAVTVGNTGFAGGLTGYTSGIIDNAFATGAVTSSGTPTSEGGLVGYTLQGSSITNGYYDASTTGQAAGTQSNGSVGLTTAQLQTGGLAALGFDTTVWGGSAGGLYPYLNSFSPNGAQAVSGFAYQNAGVTAAASNANGAITVSLDGNGGLIGQAATGANGYYYVQLNAGTLASNAGLLVSTAANASTGATNAATLATATGSTLQTGVNLYGNATTVSTTATLLSTAPILTAAKTSATAIAGADTGAVASIAATTGRGLITTGASFTIDQAVTTGSTFYVSTKSGSPLTVASAVTIVNGGSLGLLSGGALAVNAPVTVDGAGTVALAAVMDTTTVSGASLLELTFGNGAGLTFANADGSAASMPVSGQALTVNGQAYTLLYSLANTGSTGPDTGTSDIAGIDANSAAGGDNGFYALAANLTGTGTAANPQFTSALAGAYYDPPFNGTFEGLGHTITNLTIAGPSNIGLFADNAGTIRDISLAGGSIVSNDPNGAFVGSLVGWNITHGTIVNATSSATVVGGDGSNTGGLVGYSEAYSSTDVVAIVDSSATGPVSAGTNYAAVGGLVGSNYVVQGTAKIINSFATGAVAVGSTGFVGGLAGLNYGAITDDYSTGAVTSSGTPTGQGGLVGYTQGGSVITNGYYDATTSGRPSGHQSNASYGLTTAQLQGTAALPGGLSFSLGSTFSGGAAGGTTGLYPYLKRFNPNGVQAISGLAYENNGQTLLKSGANGAGLVTVAAGGQTTTVTTGANGYYYVALNNGTISANGTGVIAYTQTNANTGALDGATFNTKLTGTKTGFNVDGGYLNETADSSITSLSALNAAYQTTAGSSAATSLTPANTQITAAATAFTIDTSASASGLFSLTSAGSLTLGTGVTLTGTDVTLAASGAFVNDAGSGAVTASDRWLVYSANSTGDTFDGLDSGDTAIWGKAAGSTVTATGDRYVFANSPTLTVTTANDSKTYGTTKSVSGDYTITGFQAGVTGAYLGDTLATAVSGAASVTSTGSASTAATGSYAVQAALGTLTSGAGYTFAFQSTGSLTVNPATLTYTATAASSTYGTAPSGLTGTVTGFVNGQTLQTATSGTLAFTTAATAASNVGAYTVTGSGLTANNGNYTFAEAAANATALTVNPATLTYTATAASSTYGTAPSGLTGTVTGFVNSQTQQSATSGTLAFTTAATAASNVGSYAITGSGLTANNGNYTFTEAAANVTALTVNPATLTYTATAASSTYGTAPSGLAGTVTGFVNGQTASTATTGTLAFGTAATAASNVGSYAITGSGLTANNGNYTFTEAAANVTALTVNPATLTYTATTGSSTYGTAPSGLTGTVTGFVNGQTASTATTGTLAFGTAATAASNVGSYAITGSGLTANNGNYTFAEAASNATALTISPAQLTYTASAAIDTYGSTPSGLTGTVTGFVDGQTASTATTGTLAFGTAATATSNVGSYAITGSGLTAANGNYTFAEAASNATALTISPAQLTYTASAAIDTYGSTPGGLTGTVTGFVNGQTASTATTGTLAFGTAATATSNVGSYAITGSGLTAANGNYTFADAAGNATALTIGPAALTITASNASKTYGAAASLGTTAFTEMGLVTANGDTLSGVTLASAGSAASANVAGSPYAITASSPVGTGLSNYTISYIAGSLTVNPLAVALADTRVYDGTTAVAGSALTVTNLVGGDTITVAGSGTIAAKDVGSQALTSLSGLMLSSANYTLTGGSGAVTVTPATLTYTASAASRTYGGANPALSGTVTGFVGNDTQAVATSGTPSFNTTATATNNVGSYAITGSGLAAANGNYTFVQAASNATALTISPVALTITAANQSKTYGTVASLGTTAFTENGLINGDTLSGVTLASTGSAASANVAGSPYTITASNAVGTGLSNYAISYIAGQLTVNPAALTITASNASKTYGAAASLGTTAFTETGLVIANGDTLSGVTLASTGSAASANVAGSPYAITASNAIGTGLSNYAISYIAGQLTVNPAALTITASNASKTYGAAASLGTTAFTETGLVTANGDTLGGVTLASTGSAASVNVAGSPYAITASSPVGTGLSNYTISYIAGQLTVNPAALTITASNASKTYGAAASLGTTAFTETGLVTANGDTLGGVTLASTGSAASANVAGSPYAITASSPVGTGLSNYTISYIAGSLTVNPLAVALADTRVYDGTTAVAGSALTVTNLVGGDTITVAGSGTIAAKDVGSQALTSLSGLMLSSANYTLTGGSGAVTVTPATLTYTASAASRTYGGADPALSGSVTGFVGNDTQAAATSGALAFNTTATATSNVGSYAITGSGLAAANGNYTFVQAASNATALTISPAAIVPVAFPVTSDGLVATGLGSTTAYTLQETFGRPGEALPFIVSTPGSARSSEDNSNASQFIQNLSNPRTNQIIVCLNGACTIVPAPARTSRKTSQIETDAR